MRILRSFLAQDDKHAFETGQRSLDTALARARPAFTAAEEAIVHPRAIEDFDAVEKPVHLAHQLTLLGVPEDNAPRPGEIGYYAPAQSLVLYDGYPGPLARPGPYGALYIRPRRAPQASRRLHHAL